MLKIIWLLYWAGGFSIRGWVGCKIGTGIILVSDRMELISNLEPCNAMLRFNV